MRKIGRFYVLSSMLYLPPGSAMKLSVSKISRPRTVKSPESRLTTLDSRRVSLIMDQVIHAPRTTKPPMDEDRNPKIEGLTPSQAADSGLKLRERLGKPSKRIPYEEVLKKFGHA